MIHRNVRIIMVLAILILGSAQHAMPINAATNDKKNLGDFSEKLESSLQSSENYYDEHTINILDAFQMEGEVVKVLQPDDPLTDEDEMKTEVSQSTITVAYVEFLKKRDSIFFFKKKEIFFYDTEKGQFLTFSNVSGNEEIKEYFDEHVHELKTTMQMSSLITYLVLLFAFVLIIPLLIISFTRGGSRSTAYTYTNPSGRGISS